MRRSLWVTFAPSGREQTVTLKGSWLPYLLGATSVTLGKTIRTTSTDVLFRPLLHLPHLRHECRHVQQQAGGSVVGWVFRYVTRPSFRKQMEAEAKAAETLAYPLIRI